MVQPCCGSSLERGVRILAIIEIILAALQVGSNIRALVAAYGLFENIGISVTEEEASVTKASIIIQLVLSIMSLLLAARLFYGVNKRNLKQIRIWFIITCIIFTLNLIAVIANSIRGTTDTLNLVAAIIGFIYTLYMLWVVFAFMQELKAEASGRATGSYGRPISSYA